MVAVSRARWARALLVSLCLVLLAGAPPLALAQTQDRFDKAEARIEALAGAGKTAPALALSRKLVAASLGSSFSALRAAGRSRKAATRGQRHQRQGGGAGQPGDAGEP